ncbi:hypothetical protein L5G32_18485 [Gordonia sp. HY002]|uniref:hypothetical protein n=1 Tax=Gordonia zhenghanii TaxID=2911516 RepID=UPI001EF105A8|nr:hypothetical protein [Gordonia zhenghanii]MCF8572251.1 hypothetical protein [Gordonia zhenghanii]MCF8607576.1 hypothetical protein [Gordonia zhenghanii]
MPIVVPAVVGVVAVVAIIFGGRWALTTWIDRGMLPHTYEDADGAVRMATRMGLVLIDGDKVVYGEVTSAFPDSGAYLVVQTPSRERLTALLARSDFPPPTEIDTAHDRLRPIDRHGPESSPTLVRSERRKSGDYLTAIWDPVLRPRTVHLSAIET